MKDFNKDPRKQQELRCREYADAIYRSVFNCISIERTDRENPNDENAILDSRFAIDVTLRLPNQMVLIGQEKFLSERYSHYASVTVEHENNPHTGEAGDWSNIAAQFYFTGYENPGVGFSPWMILNWPSVVLATTNERIKWFDQINKDGHARASFRYIPMMHIPSDLVIAGDYQKQLPEYELKNGKVVPVK